MTVRELWNCPCGNPFLLFVHGVWFWCPQCDAHAAGCLNRRAEGDKVGACRGMT